MRRIEEQFIAAGKVRYTYHHFAFLGPESIRAAEASECAREQGRFWDYADTLFANQRGENQGAFADQYLKSFGDGLGLATLAFNACLDTRRYRAAVEGETLDGQQHGVQSTPTIFINGVRQEPASFEDYIKAIEAALAGVGG